MPRLPLPTATLADLDTVQPELARHVAAMASGDSPAAACTLLASLERHGVLTVEATDDLGELCRAVRGGATDPRTPVPACSAQASLRECLCASIRAVLGATLLSEHRELPATYCKPCDAPLASPPHIQHQMIKLRLVTTMCRRMTARRVLSAPHALRLATFLFSLVGAETTKCMAFDANIYDDLLGYERVLAVLARRMVQFKAHDTSVASLLVLVFVIVRRVCGSIDRPSHAWALAQVWLQANRLVQSQFREWRTPSTADAERQEDAWVRELGDDTPDNVQRIFHVLVLCVGLQRTADPVSVETLGPSRALLEVFYPQPPAFRTRCPAELVQECALDGAWRVPCATPSTSERAGSTVPDYVADHLAIAWDILYEPSTAITGALRSAVAYDFLYRIAATVRHRQASFLVPVRS